MKNTTGRETLIDDFSVSNKLRPRTLAAIPGGSHTYAKGDDQFPIQSPGFIVKGSGCHVWDVDGNRFIEFGMGLRAVSLGHGFRRVVLAAYRQMRQGCNFTRPSPLEALCAESLMSFVPNTQMVKFTKDGSSATSAAVRLARAFTGRDLVALCKDHPFFSYDDWAICTTPMAAGIPTCVGHNTLSFRYNDLQQVESLFSQHPSKIAAFILEPAKDVDPSPGYLAGLRELCHRNGALLIFDEMITGFRWPHCAAQRHYNVFADLSTFGKALGNGFAISALAGRRDIMRLGGACHDRERVFLLSSTHGAETHALAAALAVMDVYREEPVIATLERRGERLQAGVTETLINLGLENNFRLSGRPSNLVFVCSDRDGRPSQTFRTLFMQELIRRGVLAPSFVTSYSHSETDIDQTIEAVEGALRVYRHALEDGPEHYLIGRAIQPPFRRRGDLAEA